MYEKKVYLLEKAVIVKSLTKDFSAYVCAFYFLRHVRSLLNCSSNASAAFIPPSTPVSDVYPPPQKFLKKSNHPLPLKNKSTAPLDIFLPPLFGKPTIKNV